MTKKMKNAEIPTSINKEYFWYYVYTKIGKINNNIKKLDVLHVITMLFEEMIKDLNLEKKIKIFNFADLFLIRTPLRNRFCYYTQSVELSGNYRKLLFSLNKKIRRKLLKSVDIRSIDGYDENIDEKNSDA
jgi:nucleoid DNA-binding protein